MARHDKPQTTTTTTTATGAEGGPSDAAIRPFRISIPQADLDGLRERLARTRRLDADEEGAGWTYGIDQGYMRELVDHWQHRYDWRPVCSRCLLGFNPLLDLLPESVKRGDRIVQMLEMWQTPAWNKANRSPVRISLQDVW